MLSWGRMRYLGLLGFCLALAFVPSNTAHASADDALAIIPFEMVDARVVVPVSVEGSRPLSFVFDNASGGTVLNSSTAEELGIGGAPVLVVGEGIAASGAVVVEGDAVEAQAGAIRIVDGQIVMGGAEAEAVQPEGGSPVAPELVDVEAMQVAGGDSAAVYFVAGSSGVVAGGQTSAVQVALGGLVLDDIELSVLPLAHLTMPTGEPIDGIIGYDILKTFVVEVDYDAGVLRVFDRDTYAPEDGAVPHEIAFLLGNVAQPCVSSDITLPNGETVSGMFVLDAGAGADIVLNSPFVREHDLVERLGAAESPLDSVSGVTPDESPVVRSTLPGFTFCDIELSAVPVTLNLGTTGFLAGEGYGGVIGSGILSNYNIAYDYTGAVVYLAPVARQ